MTQTTLSPQEAQLLIAEAQKKTTELEVARHEMKILYDASNRLVRAATPAEQLAAISDYAQSIGANRGLLIYTEYEGEDRIDEIVAEWVIGEAQPIGVGTQLRYPTQNAISFTTPYYFLFIENALEDSRIVSGWRAVVDNYNMQGCVLMPLYSKGRRVAGITFSWDCPKTFNERDERIFTVLQQQIAFVVESMRLFDGLQKRAHELELINHELNLLYKTSELINSANTYDEVVAAVAQFDLEADVVTLMLWDTWNWETAQFLDVPVVIDRQHSGRLPVGSRLPKGAFPIAKHMMGQRVWLFEDAETDPRVDPVTAENWAALGIRSFMGPALYLNKHWLGGITFHSSKPRHYTEREERLLAGVGDLVLAAIVRIRLQNEKELARQQAEHLANTNAELLLQAQQRTIELETANHELNLLYRTSALINQANTYQEVVEAVARFDDHADVVSLIFWDNWDWRTAEHLEIAAVLDRHQISKLPAGLRLPRDTFPISEQFLGQRLVIVEDGDITTQHDPVTAANWRMYGVRSLMATNLYIEQSWIGAIGFYNHQPRQYTESQLRLLGGVGDLVLAAVIRIRLQNETQMARQEAEIHAQQAQKLASLEERTRLARELHDSVSQVLYGIGLGARTARAVAKQNPDKLHEPLDYILNLAEAGLTEMRALIFELRPESLEQEGLITSLNKQALSITARYNIRVEAEFCEEPQLPLDVKECLYRIAREALHNTVKHAQATQVRLAILQTATSYRLTIADNGLGFDTSQNFIGHLGLKSMRERTAKIGGALEITSAVGTGTTITVTINTEQFSA